MWHWLRLTRPCAVCHRRVFPWQGQTTPALYLICGLAIKAKPQRVCSERCSDVIYDWTMTRRGIRR